MDPKFKTRDPRFPLLSTYFSGLSTDLYSNYVMSRVSSTQPKQFMPKGLKISVIACRRM